MCSSDLTSDDAVPGLEEGAVFEDEASLEDWPTRGTLFEKQTSDTELGRLKLVRDLVDEHLDEKGRPTQIFAFGSRSFSILDLTTGGLVFDSGDEVAVQAGENGVRFLLISGTPIKEPVAWHGPIVMNSQEELRQAFNELNNGTFIK